MEHDLLPRHFDVMPKQTSKEKDDETGPETGRLEETPQI
jgi:hypothetical protein